MWSHQPASLTNTLDCRQAVTVTVLIKINKNQNDIKEDSDTNGVEIFTSLSSEKVTKSKQLYVSVCGTKKLQNTH